MPNPSSQIITFNSNSHNIYIFGVLKPFTRGIISFMISSFLDSILIMLNMKCLKQTAIHNAEPDTSKIVYLINVLVVT